MDDDAEEHLNDLEILEEESLEMGMNIWDEPMHSNIIYKVSQT